jgi:fused signal recognition particle receptor
MLERLKRGLARTGEGLSQGLRKLFRAAPAAVDADTLAGVEELLLTADVGVDATAALMRGLTDRGRRPASLAGVDTLVAALREEMIRILERPARAFCVPARRDRPFVILMVGVNGTGKTTTIAKLASRLRADGRSVWLAAGDTFRAAAIEQLERWGERVGVPVVSQNPGADAAAVIFDALQSATARGIDVLVADTAGRLHTQSGLMEELRKIQRVMRKLDPQAPHETLLVVDATTGQNAVAQAIEFHQAIGLSGIVLSKLDGTAKGGVAFSLAERVAVPVYFVGVGEQLDDLVPFSATAFVDALLAPLAARDA